MDNIFPGHCGVGSIVNLNNAKVASILGADMVLIANGGLGKFCFLVENAFHRFNDFPSSIFTLCGYN